jgi:hypothetical protein
MVAVFPWLLKLVRVALLMVLFVLLLSVVIAAGGPATGPFEKAGLAVVFIGVLALAIPVHRIGRSR